MECGLNLLRSDLPWQPELRVALNDNSTLQMVISLGSYIWVSLYAKVNT